ncbi:MAG: hypothetical protein V7695_11135 [Sulfitobacter sp.]
MTKPTPFLTDLCLLLLHLPFYPLAYFTLLPEVRWDLFGVGQSIIVDGLLWLSLLTSGYMIIRVKRQAHVGTLARYGTIIFFLGICILTPFIIGFAVLAIVSFVGVGFEGLMIWWRSLLFFGFLWVYFSKE